MKRRLLLFVLLLFVVALTIEVDAQQEGIFGDSEVTNIQGILDPNVFRVINIEPDKAKSFDGSTNLKGTKGWTTIMTEGFQYAWPANGWTLYSMSGYADANWKDVNCISGPSSTYTGYCAGVGANSVNCGNTGYNYPNNMYNYCLYGPFDLSDATNAKITFYYKCWTESTNDQFIYWASSNGVNYDGYAITGVRSSWTQITFDLSTYCGDNSVYFAFSFTSNGSITNKGAFVDDIILEKFTGPSILDCIADVENIKINGTTVSSNGTIDVTLNNLEETFTVALRGENDGADASPLNFNNLSMSFPQFTSSSDKARISPDYSGSSLDLNFAEYYGTEAEGCDGDAEFILTEGVASNGWNSGVSKTAMFNIKPKQWGSFVIYYRMALGRDASWGNMSFDPTEGCTSSGTRDCLGYASYKITVNVIQAAQSGDLNVTMKNIDGTSTPIPGSNGKIQLYTSGGSFLSDITTNSSGVGTFSNLNFGTYNLKFLHLNTGTIHGAERWGVLNGVNHNSNPTNEQFTRNLPYFAGTFRIYNNNTNQEVTRLSVPAGTPLRVVLEIKNPNPSQQSVKARLVFDKNKAEPYDEDHLSTAINIAGNNSIGTITYYFTCWSTGDWFGTVGTEYLEGAVYYTCDGTAWPTAAEKWLTVTATNGDLAVTMQNYNGTITPYPSSNGKIGVYNSNGSLVQEKQTNTNGVATFTALPFANYTLKFNHVLPASSSIFGQEYWGSKTKDHTQAGSDIFVRNKPFVLEHKLFNTSTGVQIPIGSEILPGTNIRFEAKIKNPSAVAESVKVRMVIDTDKTEPFKSDQTSSIVVIPANGETTISFVYQPIDVGDWYGAYGSLTKVDNNYIITDGWSWGATSNDKWFKILGNTLTTLYGSVDGHWGITLFGAQYRVFCFKKAGATNDEVIYLPFKTSSTTPTVENLVTDIEEALAVLQKFQLTNRTNAVYANYQAFRQILVTLRDYHKLGNWWQDDGSMSKRKVDRISIGKASFSTMKEVGKAMMGGGLSPLGIISAFLLPFANSGGLDGIQPTEIQAIILAQALYDGQVSGYENKPTLLRSHSLFTKLLKVSKGLENVEEMGEFSSIGIGMAVAAKIGDISTLKTLKGQLNTKLLEMSNAFLYDAGVNLLVNLTGLDDFSKEVDVYCFLSDTHFDAIYGISNDCINKLDSLVTLEAKPYTKSNAAVLNTLYADIVNRYSLHLMSLRNELVAAQYRRLQYIKSHYLYPITQYVGASQDNIDQLKYWYDNITYPEWNTHSEAFRNFFSAIYTDKSAYEGAIDALKSITSNDNLHLISPAENGILKIGQSNSVTYQLKNNFPSSLQIQSITIADISGMIQTTPGQQAISLASGETKNLTVTAVVPRNYIDNNISDPDLLSRTEFNVKINWVVGQSQYEKNYRTKHVIGSFIKIDSAISAKGIFRPGETAQVKTKCSSTQGFNNIANGQWLYKPDGTWYQLQSVIVNSSGVSTSTYVLPNGPFGAYGYYGYLYDQNKLTPPMFQNKVLYLVPNIDGNISAFNWSNLKIFYAPADSFAARNFKEVLQIPNDRYINVNNYTLAQLRSMAQTGNSILVGGHLANPLVNDLGQFNLVKEGDAIIKHFTAAFGTRDAVVVAGWKVRDTDIASMGLLDYYKSNVGTPSGYTLSGTVKYANTQNSPLKLVTVNLKQNGNIIQTTQSNTLGEYTFSNVAPGTYTLTCTTNNAWGGVTGADALLVQMYVINPSLITDPLKLCAADVNLVGGITGADALLNKRRVAFLINEFPAGDWCFEVPSVTISNQNVVQAIRGICTGDVNGSYIPPVEIFTNPLNNNNRIGE